MNEEERTRKRSVTITVWMKQDVIKLVEELAKKAGKSKNKIISNIIGVGLERLSEQERLSVVKLIFLVKEFRDRVIEEVDKIDEKGKENVRGESITLRLDQEVVDHLEKWANDLDITRSKLVQSLLDVVAEDLRLYATLGMIDLVLITEKIKSIWNEQLKDTEKLLKNRVLKLKGN